MIEPAAFIALLSLFASLGAIAFASRSVTRLADQYAEFVQVHINGIRSEIGKKGKDQTRTLEALAKESRLVAQERARAQQELEELRQVIAELKVRVGCAEEEMNARMPARRCAKTAALRAFDQ